VPRILERMPVQRERSARATPADKPLRQFAVGRSCLLCGARLSRYNSTRFCFVHQPKNFRVPAAGG